jgi:hypothetical protein
VVGFSEQTFDRAHTRGPSPCGSCILLLLTLHRTALRRKYGLPPACPLLPEAADDCCVHLCCGAAAARQVPQALSPSFCGSFNTLSHALLLSGVLFVPELCHVLFVCVGNPIVC